MSDMMGTHQKRGSDIHERQINQPWMYHLLRQSRKRVHSKAAAWLSSECRMKMSAGKEGKQRSNQKPFPPLKSGPL